MFNIEWGASLDKVRKAEEKVNNRNIVIYENGLEYALMMHGEPFILHYGFTDGVLNYINLKNNSKPMDEVLFETLVLKLETQFTAFLNKPHYVIVNQNKSAAKWFLDDDSLLHMEYALGDKQFAVFEKIPIGETAADFFKNMQMVDNLPPNFKAGRLE